MADLSAAAREVLDFWLAPAMVPRWFVLDEQLDAQIRQRFGGLVEQAQRGELDDWRTSPRSGLALLILLDQFPRNLFRGDARAFASDPAAQQLALEMIGRGDDLRIPVAQRLFVYLPLEHAENPDLQDRSVQLFTAMAAEANDEDKAMAQLYLDYARKHRDAIARFGRFPGRNAALGRPGTPEEKSFLDAGGGF